MSARRGALVVAWAALGLAPAARALEAAPAGADGDGPPRVHARSVQARVERTDVRLGAPFAYEVEVVHPPDETVSLAATLDAPPFRGAGGTCRREPLPDAAGGDRVRTTCALELALFDLGRHDVPLLRLLVRTPAGEATLPVEGPRVTGVGMADPATPPEALALRPLAAPVPLLVPTWAPVAWAIGAAAALAVALLARRLWRARARAVAEPPPPEPPEERLARRLDALAARRPPPREHYFELSAIVREWVAGVTGLRAAELTTAELEDRLAAEGDPRVNGPAIVAFLRDADLVKFALGRASPERCAAAVAWARRLPATAAARAAADRAAIAAAGGERP
jgi:hypothetical protein